MPPRAQIPTWMVEDRELMEAWAQDIRTQMPPFLGQGPEVTRHDQSGIMTWDSTCVREANLVALRDIQPTEQERRIYGWWDQLDALVWQLADKALKGRQAPREVQQVRRLNTAVNGSTMHNVFEDGWRIVRQQS